MKKFFVLFLLLCVPAHAEETVKPAAIVAELFTSQGCSSCPPAQAFMAEMAKRDDVLALELHVDYWDDLKTMFHGTWKDPYSDSVWSQRQLEYNRRLTGEERVYTPQIIIDGKFQEAGTNRRAVKSYIDQARSQRPGRYDINTTPVAEGVSVTVNGAGKGIMKPLQVVLARIIIKSSTKITAGENSGTTQLSRNIVKDMMVVGTWSGGRESYQAPIPAFKTNEGCAVLLQDPENMHILAGARCNL